MSSVKKACITSVCVALCCVLPIAFHMVGLGAAFTPLHLPTLLCGALCGPVYGGFCSMAGAAVSSVLTGMPTAFQLIYMIPEMAVYGVSAGLFVRLIRTRRTTLDVLLTLIPAIALGRIVGGVCQAALYLFTARDYSLALWAGGYLLTTVPGTVLNLIAVPLLAATLEKTGLVPKRYPKGVSV